jgi:arsenate reductase (thioredoxin)
MNDRRLDGGQSMGARNQNVLFVCLHGSAKSLIAAEYFNRLAAARGLPARATSAGTEPDDAIPPRVMQGLGADGIDVASRRPRRPTQADLDESAVVVTFACDLGDLASRAPRVVRWDDVPAVSEDFKRARDVIVARVTALLEDAAIKG